MIKSCPCGSKQDYEVCCKVFHQGKWPENALLLMRSRYSAYALNLPDYILETTHPENPQYSKNRSSWKQSISQFSLLTSFQKLEILGFEENGDEATVTFTAHLVQAGRDATFTEKSYFEKVKGRWLYKRGVVS